MIPPVMADPVFIGEQPSQVNRTRGWSLRLSGAIRSRSADGARFALRRYVTRPSGMKMKVRTKTGWLVPLMLVGLSIIPLLVGIAHVSSSLSGRAEVTPAIARFHDSPIPIFAHVVAVTLYSLLGAFQFSSGVRLRWPRWHRYAGRLLVACGVLSGLSGLWMTIFYPIPRALQGPLLYSVRVAVGVTMVAAIAIAWRSILRRDVAKHEAWMMRGYALGQGAGTQVLVLAPWTLATGDSEGLTRDVLMSAAWLINLAFAEWRIRREQEPCHPARMIDAAATTSGSPARAAE